MKRQVTRQGQGIDRALFEPELGSHCALPPHREKPYLPCRAAGLRTALGQSSLPDPIAKEQGSSSRPSPLVQIEEGVGGEGGDESGSEREGGKGGSMGSVGSSSGSGRESESEEGGEYGSEEESRDEVKFAGGAEGDQELNSGGPPAWAVVLDGLQLDNLVACEVLKAAFQVCGTHALWTHTVAPYPR